MKNICLYFQVHQPFRFRSYRFFDIGNDSYYYDDYANETIMSKVAQRCYLSANERLLKTIEASEGHFKVSFSISGVALEQFELYAPEVIESFKSLAKTGCVEFLAETYAHSLVALKSGPEFKDQVMRHSQKIFELFGQKPKVFRNTELIYSDEIGDAVSKMGYHGILAEGAKHVLGWKSPNYLYCNSINPRLKVLLRNFKLSDDIGYKFSNTDWSEHPLTAEKFCNWIDSIDENEELINLFLDYESLGEHQRKETGILDFLEIFPLEIIKNSAAKFMHPSEAVERLQPISAVHVPFPSSWADEERDLSAWLGNEMQDEAYTKLYDCSEKMTKCNDPELIKDWNYLQTSDHFYYMCTKHFSDGEIHNNINPYSSPYEAFMNYMNVLSDFEIRLNEMIPENKVEKEIAKLRNELSEKNDEIKRIKNEKKKSRINKTTRNKA